jgi:hypothetical protein
VARAYRAGTLTSEGPTEQDPRRGRRRRLTPSPQRSGVARLTAGPRAYGWCRTRWRWATVALEVQARRGGPGPAEALRRGRHARGWAWKRAKLAAKGDGPQRVEKLARLRVVVDHLPATAARCFAGELDIPLVPTGGSRWLPQGDQVEVLTPGSNAKRDWAGAWEMRTGPVIPRGWWRKAQGLVLGLPQARGRASPVARCARPYGAVDNDKIPNAQAVAQGRAAPPRCEALCLPTSCPKASPSERACGEVHDKGARNQRRKRLWAGGRAVGQPLSSNGPGHSEVSELYSPPEVTAALQDLRPAERAPEEIAQLAA